MDSRVRFLIGFILAACSFQMMLPAATPEKTARAEVSAHDEGIPADGITPVTEAIQRAVDKLAAGGGGTLRFTAGKYLTGTVNLRPHTHLFLERDALLLGSLNPADYPAVGEFFDGRGSKCNRVLINARGGVDVRISGPGTIDGQGDLMTGMNPRPFLVRFQDCTNAVLEDVTLKRASMWTCHLWGSTNVLVNRVTIQSNPHGANNDGIDIDGSSDVTVSDCSITSGDDAVCLKATVDRPCRGISILRCSMDTLWNGFKIGTESVGDFEDISVTDCEFVRNIKGGIRIYSVDGAHIRGVRLENIRLRDVNLPLYIRLGARMRAFRTGDRPREGAGSVSGIIVRNVSGTAKRSQGTVLISGIPGFPVRDVKMENLNLTVPGGDDGSKLGIPMQERENAYPEPYTVFGPLPAYGFVLRHVNGCTFSNVTVRCVKTDARPAVACIDAGNLTLTSMHFLNPPDNPPAGLLVRDSPPGSVRCENWYPPEKPIGLR